MGLCSRIEAINRGETLPRETAPVTTPGSVADWAERYRTKTITAEAIPPLLRDAVTTWLLEHPRRLRPRTTARAKSG